MTISQDLFEKWYDNSSKLLKLYYSYNKHSKMLVIVSFLSSAMNLIANKKVQLK